jgi:3-dehydroquinate dehydratase/shikimate dehydrogenase
MGDDALAARVLALRQGSALAYASIGQATAPGQVSLDALQTVYRLDRRFGSSRSGPARGTRIYGVIGNPIGHSLSPLMHNAAFAARKVNAILLPFHVKSLRDFLASVEPLGITGFGVTLPYKQAILRYLDDCDPLATQVGAVNTVVVRRGGRLCGYNTDYVGVLRAIESRVPLRGSRVLLIGAGGAARAAAFALAHAGAVVAICARRPAQARALARAVAGSVVERHALRQEFFDAIVNCTPVGMHPGGGSPLKARELNCRVVMDLIYRPRLTELLRRAGRRGIEVISGAEMFVAQGAAQWEIWSGERAPEAAMRRVVNAALDREERKASGA